MAMSGAGRTNCQGTKGGWSPTGREMGLFSRRFYRYKGAILP